MRRLIYILLLAVGTCVVHAQTDAKMRDIYSQAESDYQIGRIEQARDGLLQHLSTMHGQLRQNALRLIALTYLARFDMEQTEQYVTLLLQENPYYTPSGRSGSVCRYCERYQGGYDGYHYDSLEPG